jgi:uncharacterized membrane protein
MERSAHLWAVGYDDIDRAGQVRQVIVSLAGPEQYLELRDIAVLVRSPDSSLTLNGNPFSAGKHLVAHGLLGVLAGVALAAPIVNEEAIAWLFDSNPLEMSNALHIADDFKQKIADMMRPRTSALLVLDMARNMTAILGRLQGMGGTILKANVDFERASLIQSILSTKAMAQSPNPINERTSHPGPVPSLPLGAEDRQSTRRTDGGR